MVFFYRKVYDTAGLRAFIWRRDDRIKSIGELIKLKIRRTLNALYALNDLNRAA
jgi:hypothetical protein